MGCAMGKRNVLFNLNTISKHKIYLILLIIITLTLSTEGIRDEETVSLQGDMCKYLMNGAFCYDLLKDFPITSPISYALQYYARYPALSLGHHPVLLGIAEIPFYAMFGVSVFSGRLSITFFILIAMTTLFYLIKIVYGDDVAFFSTLLFVTNPFIVAYSRIVMSEIPALACIITAAYFLTKYCITYKNRYLYLFSLMVVVSISAKHLALLMLPVFVLYGFLVKKKGSYKIKNVTWAIVIVFLFLSLFAFFTLKYSSSHLHWVTQQSLLSRISPESVLHHLKIIAHYHFMIPLLIVGLFSIGMSIYRKDTRSILFFLWIGGYFIQITLLGVKDARYSIYWIPAFCAFMGFFYLWYPFRSWKIFSSVLLIILASHQFTLAYQSEPDICGGYEDAAKYILKHRKGKSVLFCSNIDTGYFIFFVRKHSPIQNIVILRADKVLATSFMREIINDRISNRKQIYDILNDYGTGYVVIEDQNYNSLPLKWLKEEVKSDKFVLREKIPLRTNRNRIKGTNLLIYEYGNGRDAKPGMLLSIGIPLIGKTIEVGYDKLISNQKP